MTTSRSRIAAEVHSLECRIKKARTFGDVKLAVESHQHSPDSGSPHHLNELLEKHGLHEIGDSWTSLDRQCATNTIAKCIRCDTFGWVAAMPAETAEQLTLRFLAFFQSDAEFFANFHVDAGLPMEPGPEGFSYMSASPWTSDIGVAVVDKDKAGFFWVMDED